MRRVVIVIVIVLIVVVILYCLRKGDSSEIVEVTSRQATSPGKTSDLLAFEPDQNQIEVSTSSQCSLIDLLPPSNLKAEEGSKPGSWKITWNGVSNSSGYHLDVKGVQPIHTSGTEVQLELESLGDLDINLKSYNENCDVESVPISLHADAN